MERVSFDDLLFEQLRVKSEEYEFAWSDLYETDAEGKQSEDWPQLLNLVNEVTPNIETRNCQTDSSVVVSTSRFDITL